MVHYNNGKIFKVVNGKTKKQCYGMTTQKLSRALANIKQRIKNVKYTPFAAVIDDGAYYISLVEEYPCNSKQELDARLHYHIENNENCNFELVGG